MSHRVKSGRNTTGKERNNSCPCGSGLKYKKCCGKHIHVVSSMPEPVNKKRKKTVQEKIAGAYIEPEKVQAFMARIERMSRRGW